MGQNYGLAARDGLRATISTHVPPSVPILDFSYIQLAPLPIVVAYLVAGPRPLSPRSLSPDHHALLSSRLLHLSRYNKNWAGEFQKAPLWITWTADIFFSVQTATLSLPDDLEQLLLLRMVTLLAAGPLAQGA